MEAIETARLRLVILPRAYLAAVVVGDARPDIGFVDPHGFLDGAEDVAALRLRQIDRDPRVEPWLLRAIVVRTTNIAVGFINFHDMPDPRGRVEIGYEVRPEHRRRGYAREAVGGYVAWSAERGARIVRASVSPANAASRALIAKEGYRLVGTQQDEVDGLELVYEKPVVPLS